MALSEFEIIKQYFTRSTKQPGCELGVGDDCALLTVEPGMQMAVTIDTLVENVHFFTDVDAQALGYKSLAVSLSDLSAMGAEPRYATLALTLPEVNALWLQGFSDGFFELADQYHLDLIGGDITRGPLSITIQAHGVVPDGQALLRSGAGIGDLIYVTGVIGDAGLALKSCRGDVQCCDPLMLNRLHKPEPRVEAGLVLRNLASACVDISDGLAADLSHVLQASKVGAVVNADELPLSEAVQSYQQRNSQPDFALTAGEDYELCFTVPEKNVKQLEISSRNWSYPCTCIGRIDNSGQLSFLKNGQRIEITGNSYQHFS
ncbi:MAG TPA: thiamine-phosphate kinase [Crenotrichaceae bacterium]|nr:thiamine-phosphate kinase [Crenotrichaceae bacterium]